MRSWHARAAMLYYLQVSVFYNLFLLHDSATKRRIEALVVGLMCDEQLEVHVTCYFSAWALLKLNLSVVHFNVYIERYLCMH